MKCVVCMEREAPSFAVLCHPCGKSYRQIDFTMAAVIEWAAKRARRFERARARKLARLRERLG